MVYKMSRQQYIQLGEKRNNRIYKAENYDVDELYHIVSVRSGLALIEKPSWVDKVFNTKKLKNYYMRMGEKKALAEAFAEMRTLIDMDKPRGKQK